MSPDKISNIEPICSTDANTNITCKNCSTVFIGKYCNKCGQSAGVARVNSTTFFKDIRSALIHFDTSFFYTIKRIFTKPGYAILDYLAGKRVKYLNPVAMLLLLAGLISFLHAFFSIEFVNTNTTPNLNLEKIKAFNHYSSKYYAYLILLTIPILSLGTWIAFHKQGFNFYEYLIMNIFKAMQRLTIAICAFPIISVFNNSVYLNTINLLIYLFDIGINFWTNIQFFNKMPVWKIIGLSIISHIIALTIIIALFTLWMLI